MNRTIISTLLLVAAPVIVSAQGAPVSKAFRDEAMSKATNLIAAAETMPADKYGYKPTPVQMSFGDVVVHLAQGNDFLCATIGGTKAPTKNV